MERSYEKFVQTGYGMIRIWESRDVGEVVVFLHGLGGFIETWKPQFLKLRNQYRCISIDLPGFGLSDKLKKGLTPSDYSSFLASFFRERNIHQAHIAGHSMGGAIALQFSLDFPDMVKSLILAAPAGLSRNILLQLRLLNLPVLAPLCLRPSRGGTKNFIRLTVASMSCFPESFIDLSHEYASLPGASQSFLLTARKNIGYFGCRKSILKKIQEHLENICVPVLLFWGVKDRIIPYGPASKHFRRFRSAELVIFEEGGHTPQAEYYDTVNLRISEFLKDSFKRKAAICNTSQ